MLCEELSKLILFDFPFNLLLNYAIDKHLQTTPWWVLTYIGKTFSTGTPNPSECLLNLICEMTRVPLSEGATHIYLDHYSESEPEYAIADDYGRNIYHKLINAIFT